MPLVESNVTEISLTQIELNMKAVSAAGTEQHEVRGLAGEPITQDPINNMSSSMGAQGNMVIYRTGNRSTTVTITLQANAPSLPKFIEWGEKVGRGELIKFELSYYDPNSEHRDVYKKGSLGPRPGGQGFTATEVSPNAFSFMFESVERDVSGSLLNVPPTDE